MPNTPVQAAAEGLPNILIPYPGHAAIDQMDGALGKLRILKLAASAAAQGIDTISDFDLEGALADILDEFDPVRAYLAENDLDDRRVSFIECRRQWFERVGGVK